MRVASWQKDIWLEFTVDGLCGLCGNWGKMPEIHTVSPDGCPRIMKAGRYCVCLNGRAMKKSLEQSAARRRKANATK